MRTNIVTFVFGVLISFGGRTLSNEEDTDFDFIIFEEYLEAPSSLEAVSKLDILGYSPENDFCKRFCVVEALSGVQIEMIPDICETRCPQYIFPRKYLNPNAICRRCPFECNICSCVTGECLPLLTDSDAQAPSEDDVEAKVAGSVPVSSYFCAKCTPLEICIRFWWCSEEP